MGVWQRLAQGSIAHPLDPYLFFSPTRSVWGTGSGAGAGWLAGWSGMGPCGCAQNRVERRGEKRKKRRCPPPHDPGRAATEQNMRRWDEARTIGSMDVKVPPNSPPAVNLASSRRCFFETMNPDVTHAAPSVVGTRADVRLQPCRGSTDTHRQPVPPASQVRTGSVRGQAAIVVATQVERGETSTMHAAGESHLQWAPPRSR